MEQANCQMALIGRKEAIPKVSNHNFLDTIGKHIFYELCSIYFSGGPFIFKDGRYESIVTRHLNPGRWYLGLLNDQSESCTFDVSIRILSSSCSNSCNGNGLCKDSKCSCFSGWTGDDCSIGICQSVCSGNGFWNELSGKCSCYNGWKGTWCNIKEKECTTCTNGQCINGECICNEGYDGVTCEQLKCPAACSQNGICQSNGSCRCFQGNS